MPAYRRRRSRIGRQWRKVRIHSPTEHIAATPTQMSSAAKFEPKTEMKVARDASTGSAQRNKLHWTSYPFISRVGVRSSQPQTWCHLLSSIRAPDRDCAPRAKR